MLLMLGACGPGPLEGQPRDVPPLDAPALAVDDDVSTMILADWDEPAASVAWLEYRFETDAWIAAPAIDRGHGVLLGIPAETAVEARLAAVIDGEVRRSDAVSITTGTLPELLLPPTIEAWDPELASPERYVMVSVASAPYRFAPPYYIEIFDRSGRVVWYHEVPRRMLAFYPSIARDGTHIWYDGDNVFGIGEGSPYVTRMTLDGRWSRTLDVPDLGQAIGEGPDRTFFYEQRTEGTQALAQLGADGTPTRIWDCRAWMAAYGLRHQNCYMNTTNWSEDRHTVLASMFVSDTVFEIDLGTGAPIRQMGQLDVGEPYTFDPPESMFAYQHHVYWTDDGTLLASTHIEGQEGTQVAAEYAVDDTTKTLTRVWDYTSTDRWATQVGEAIRLPNGNLVQGYGQDGAIREVTHDGDTAWEASFPLDDDGYRVIGHTTLVDDLYALTRGPEQAGLAGPFDE